MRWLIVLVIGAVIALCLLRSCTRKVPIPSGTIAFLGDSLTEGHGLDPAQAYPALVEIKGMTMLNLGVSGSKTEDGLQRLKDYFQNGGSPRLVVIALGANDILHGVAPGVTEANLESAIQECKNRGVPVMLCGIRIPGKFGTDAIFKQAAGNNRVPLLLDVMAGEASEENYLQDDGHPNADGQKLMAEKMQAALLDSFSFGANGQK
jgi:acyl-CoA thioesterase I